MINWMKKDCIWKQRPESSQLLISEEKVKETGEPRADAPGWDENNCESKPKHGSSLQERRQREKNHPYNKTEQ